MPVTNLPLEFPLPPIFADEAIELRFERMMRPTTDDVRPNRAPWSTPQCSFVIHRRLDAAPIGTLLFRLTHHSAVLQLLGHVGVAIDPAHQRHGYATRVCRLLPQIARFYDLSPLWILIEPANVAARRAAERAGLPLFDIVNTAPATRAFAVPPQLCRYRWEADGSPSETGAGPLTTRF